MTAEELYTALSIPPGDFRARYAERARAVRAEHFGDTIAVSGLLAVSNICRNRCTYCGLRAPNTAIPRYRLSLEEIQRALAGIREQGIGRVFFISGEDPGLDTGEMLQAVEYASGLGLRVMLGLGVLTPEDYADFRHAGAELYALKFETSNRAVFDEVKPDISLDERIQSIREVQQADLELGSGNIVGLPGERLEDLVNDIALMKELEIGWAPIVPYLPAPNTPLGAAQPMGSVELLLREISLVRLELPDTLITAGQPTQGSQLGFSDPEGTKNAIAAGANLLFVDLTPKERREDFAITPQRILPRLEAIDSQLAELGLQWESAGGGPTADRTTPARGRGESET
jgi:biotin synthase